MKFKLRYLAAAVALANSALAADPEGTLEQVVVWGTAVESSSLKLDQHNIDLKQADHISDLLRTLPGVDVGGAHSLNQRITIRSMDDKDIDITIDGVRQNTYMYHHMGNLQIHADILKSVDVAVGNNSVVNSGLGGAVRFETKEAKELLQTGDRWGARVQAQVSSNASQSVAVSTYGQVTNSIDVLAYLNYVDRENYEVGGGKIKDQNGLEVANTDGEVRGLEGELSDGLLKFGWDITSNQRLALSYEAYKDEGDYSYRPDMGLATDLAIANSLNIPVVYPTEFTRDTINLTYAIDVADHTSLKLALYENTSTLWRDERGLQPWRPTAATLNEGEAKNTGLNLLGTSELGKGSVIHQLTYGFEAVNYETEYLVNQEYVSGERSDNLSLFAENRMAMGDFIVTPGLRFDSAEVESAVVSEQFNNVGGSLALEYNLSNQLVLVASATTLWKAPEIGEVFIGAGLGDTANPDIEAEDGVNKELGVHYAQSGWSAGITSFTTDIDGYIYDYATIPGSTDDWKANVGDMTIEGFEAYLGYQQQALTVMFTASRAESNLSAYSDYAQYDGARLDRQQGDTLALSIDYDIFQSGVTLHWDTQWVDDVDAGPDLDGATLDNAKDGYTVHNISARWLPQQIEGLALTLGVDNVLDEFYSSQSSRTGTSFHPVFGPLYLQDYEPGRNVKATIAYQF